MLELLLCFLLLPQVALPTQTPAPVVQANAPAEDPLVTALARKIYSQMRAGKVDEALMTSEMNKALSPDVLAAQKPIFDQLGDPLKLTLESTEKTAAGAKWVYLATFATAQLHMTILVMKDGRVGGYDLAL
jgi:hypothetical protein